MRRTLLSAGTPILACFALAACDPAAGTRPRTTLDDPPGVVFLAEETAANAYMDALFQGGVTLDTQGCLRLDTSERHTVVWPHGYTLEASSGAFRVKDEQGRLVGTIGGSFRFGGGEVPSLASVVNLSASARAQAEANCPGRYWLASPEG